MGGEGGGGGGGGEEGNHGRGKKKGREDVRELERRWEES